MQVPTCHAPVEKHVNLSVTCYINNSTLCWYAAEMKLCFTNDITLQLDNNVNYGAILAMMGCGSF